MAFAGYLCILISCKDGKVSAIHTTDQTLVFNAAHVDTLLSNTIERIDFLALEPTENADVFEISKMVVKNDLIFMDDSKSAKIVVYDMNGKVKYILDHKGAGPQEYLELKSFAVDEQNLYTLDNFRHKINVYDCRSGIFKESRKLSFVAWDMEVLDDNHFIFAFIPLEGAVLKVEQPPYKILITDRNLEITNNYFKYEHDEYEVIGRRTPYFASMEEGVVFSSMDADHFTIFYQEDSVKHIAIDFADKIPEKYRRDWKKISENGYNYMAEVPILCKNYMAFEFSVGEDMMNYLYDDNAGCFHGNTYVSSYNYLFHPLASYQNRLVSYLDDPSLYEELTETGFVRASAAIEQHLENEGAILIFYTMR